MTSKSQTTVKSRLHKELKSSSDSTASFSPLPPASDGTCPPISSKADDSSVISESFKPKRNVSPYPLLFVMFFAALTISMIVAPFQQIVLRLVCVQYYSGNTLGFKSLFGIIPHPNQNFLLNETISNPDEITAEMCNIPEVQAQSTTFLMTTQLLQTVPAMFTTTIYGKLSDNPRFGRKPFMLMPLLGNSINLIAILLIDRFQLPLATLAAGYFLEGFTGSFSTVMSCLFAYVTDTVPVASRTVIFTLIEGAFFLGFTVGPLLMAFIISQTKSNITIFYVALIGNILTVSFLWFWVKESRDYDSTKDDKRGWSIWKLAKEYCNIFNSLKVLIEPFSRARLILIGIFLVIQICFRGFMLIFIVYTNARFGWTSKEDGYYFFIQCLAKIVAIGLLTPLVSWISGVPLRSPSKTEEVVDMEVEQASASSSSSSSHEGKCCAHIPHEDEDNEVPTEFTQLLNSDIADVEKSIVAQDREQKPGVWLDGILIKSGLLIYCLAFFAFGLANEGWMFYAITIFDSAAILLFPSLRATITKTVEQSKQGTLLSSLGILESIAGILSPIIFNTIYTATVSTHPNIIFFVIGVAYFLAFLVSLVVRRREIGVKEENNAEEFTDEDS